MNRRINYGCFSRVKDIVMSCNFDTQEEKEQAFKALVKCLVEKHVYRFDGKIVKDRLSCINYLVIVCPKLEDEELDLMVKKPGVFYDKFVFAPNKGGISLFSELQKPTLKSKFQGVPMDEIFADYREETGYSPYEKTSKDDLEYFFSQEEVLCY